MKKKLLLTGLGLGALSITLIALPGSSARIQGCDSSTLARLEAKLQQLETARAVKAAPLASSLQEITDRVIENIEEHPREAQGDVQILVGTDAGWLGVESSEVTPQIAGQLKLPAERGALVGKVLPDSPAAKAGLKENDVITEINGQRVEGAAQFRRMIREIPSGRTVQFTVWRDGRSQTLSATLGKSEEGHKFRMQAAPGAYSFTMPELPEVAELPEMNWGGLLAPSGRARLGIDAEDLNGPFGNYFGAPEGEGILVRDVNSGSPAEKAGLKAGDVITSIDGDRVRPLDVASDPGVRVAPRLGAVRR